jgi:hypothetical protein
MQVGCLASYSGVPPKYSAPEIRSQVAPGRALRARRDDDGLAAPMLGGATQPSAFGTSEMGPNFRKAVLRVIAIRAEIMKGLNIVWSKDTVPNSHVIVAGCCHRIVRIVGFSEPAV